MARSKQNPDKGTTMVLLAGAAAVAYYGYTQGWFSSFIPVATIAPPAPPPSTSTGNPITAGATVVNAPTTPPPLGTVVSNPSDAAAQVAANLAYIIPDPSIASSARFGNYVQTSYWVTDANGNRTSQLIYLRPDVAAAVSSDVASRMARAQSAGADQTSISNASFDTLDQISATMSQKGLSGMRWRIG